MRAPAKLDVGMQAIPTPRSCSVRVAETCSGSLSLWRGQRDDGHVETQGFEKSNTEFKENNHLFWRWEPRAAQQLRKWIEDCEVFVLLQKLWSLFHGGEQTAAKKRKDQFWWCVVSIG